MIEIIIVLLIIAAVITLFAFELLPIEVIGLFVIFFLAVTQILEPDQVFTSFGNSAIIMIGGIMVMTGGLIHNGVADRLSRRMRRLAGGSEKKIMVMLYSSVGALSAFINNVAATAMFIPVAEGISKSYKVNPGKYLMPIAFASLLGGVCTLVGTSTNVAVSGSLGSYGIKPISMFELTPVGIIIAFVGLIYLYFISEKFLSKERVLDRAEDFHIKEFLFEIIVSPDSPYDGKRLSELDFIKRFGLTVVGIVRGTEKILSPDDRELILKGDLLFVEGNIREIIEFKEIKGIEIKSDIKLGSGDLESEKVKMVEATISYNSPFIGKTLKEIDFRYRYGVNVLALYRRGESLVEKVGRIRLKLGDVLLVQGLEEKFTRLWEEPNMLLLEDVILPKYHRKKAYLATTIFTSAIVLSSLGLLSAPLVFFGGAIFMILFKVLKVQEAYQYLNLKVLFLIAGMISLGKAMETTGTAAFLADIAVNLFGSSHTLVLLSVFFFLTVLLTQPVSNAAAALLMIPVGINAAQLLGVNPRTFVIAITIAASCAFITPLEPACLLVYSAGRYRYIDFIKVGLFLTLVAFLISIILIPILWPLDAPF